MERAISMDTPAGLPRPRAGSFRHNNCTTKDQSKPKYIARLLCRNNELLHSSRVFATWAAATRECKLKGHMNRCSIMMRHSLLRQGYSRFFLRWLTFTQIRASENYRSAIQLRQDVPLRSKADFLALAHRYFVKWRAYLREKKQRTVANVDLLAALNRERLRYRALLKWWKFYHTTITKQHQLEVQEQMDTLQRLHEEVLKAVNEAETVRDRLKVSLQAQAQLQGELDMIRGDMEALQHSAQAEIKGLRDSICKAIEVMEGSGGPNHRLLCKGSTASQMRNSNPLPNVVDLSLARSNSSATPDVISSPLLAPSIAGSPVNSAQYSKDTQLALARSVENALVALTDLGRSVAIPMSIEESIENIRRRLEEDAEVLANVKAQRDEFVTATKTVRLAFATVSPPLTANGTSIIDCEQDMSHVASVGLSRTGGGNNRASGTSQTSAVRSSHRADCSGSRRACAAEAIISSSLPVVNLSSETPTPSATLPNSPREGGPAEWQHLPQLLVADAKSLVSTVMMLRKNEQQAKSEVMDLQDAALRAIDALGGSGVVSDDFNASPDETDEARAQRSDAIAMGLRNLCEDMIVVLVLTSLWSGKRASERVCEALERLWRRTQELEATQTEYLEQLDVFGKVISIAARILRQPTTVSADPSPQRTSAAGARKRRANTSGKDGRRREGAPTVDELDDARRCADDLATKGDPKPAELLQLCEEVLRRSTTQSTLLTSELEDLLQGSQELLAATVGVKKDDVVRPATMPPASGQDERSEPAASPASQSTQETVAALKAASQKVAGALKEVGDGANRPLILATQDVAAQLAQVKNTNAELEAQLRAAEEQVKNMEKQHKRDANEFTATELALRQKLETLGQQLAQNEATRKQLEEILQKETEAHKQALKNFEEQRETVKTERQLHGEEMEKAKEAQDAVVRKNEKLQANIEELKKKLLSAEAQLTSSNEREQELMKQLEGLAQLQTETDAAKRALEDQWATAKEASDAEAAVRAKLEQQLLFVEGENRVNNAVGVFLRDVVRDCLTRLHHLTRSVGYEETLSPRASLILQQTTDSLPPLLTHDSDPSEYVEYILRLDGNDPIGKRLVQEHLRNNSAVHGVKLPLAAVAGEDSLTAMTARDAPASGSPLAGDSFDPSTWEVVAELHDRLVLLYERFAHLDQVAADQLAMNDTLSRKMDQLCADALAALKQLQPWSSAAAAATTQPVKTLSRSTSPVSSSASPRKTKEQSVHPVTTVEPEVAGSALRTSSSEVVQALEALHQVADSVRPLIRLRSPASASRCTSVFTSGPNGTAASTEHLPALVADMQGMAGCLQSLAASVQHGILTLGGALTNEDEELAGNGTMAGTTAAGSGGGGSPRRADLTLHDDSSASGNGGTYDIISGKAGVKLDSCVLAARLEAICEETGTSIIEITRLLLGTEGQLDASQDSVKPVKLGDVIPQIQSKMAELEEVKRESARLLNGLNRAFDDEDSLFAASTSSLHSRSIKPKKKPLPAFQGTPEAGLRLMQQEIKGKKGRRDRGPADGAALVTSMGSHIRERLSDLQNLRKVCRSTLQVLEGRAITEEDQQPPTYGEALVALLTTQVADLKQAVAESEEALKGYRSDLRNVTVGTRLHLLADVVNSLKLERDSLKEDINRRGRQSNILLDGLNKEVKMLKTTLEARQEAYSQLASANDGMSEELEAQKRNAAELTAQLEEVQHKANVLSTALARSLQGLAASTHHGETPNVVKEDIQAALKTDHGDALTKSVEEAVHAAAQHQQHLRDIFHNNLHNLRKDLQELREVVAQNWALYGAPMAEAASQLVAETAEILTLENDMLRPRAVEREKLKHDMANLEAALAEANGLRDAAVERLCQLDDENTQLRRALRDAEMTQVLNNNTADGGAAQVSRELDRRVVDWERRMIAGATDLAMDAIDSMSGRSMSAVFGSMAEEMLRIYKEVRTCLRGVTQACVAARGTDGRQLRVKVEACLHDLDALSASADYLSTRMPVLYSDSYS